MKSFRVFLKEDVATQTTTALPEIYLDMDETIVDWMSGANAALRAAGLPEWKDKHWDTLSDDDADEQRWGAVNANPTFWEDLDFMPDGRRIWNFVKKYKPKILSACGPTAKDCKRGKMVWLKKHLGLKNLGGIHLVRRTDKKKFAVVDDKPTILIDDYLKNCQEYKIAGGIAIQATNGNDVIAKLKRLGFK